MSIPKAEMELDYTNTVLDINKLQAIVTAISGLIVHSGGENRSFLKRDLIKYQSMLCEATKLRDAISSAMGDRQGNDLCGDNVATSPNPISPQQVTPL